MHSDHDLDLVIALADGSLADPAPAEELIAACSECADTYEAYLTVRTAVAAAPTPAMTELEKRRLSNSLWAEIAEDQTAAGTVSTTPTRDAAPTRRTRSDTPTRRSRSDTPTRHTRTPHPPHPLVVPGRPGGGRTGSGGRGGRESHRRLGLLDF
jgi:hypothetical protein